MTPDIPRIGFIHFGEVAELRCDQENPQAVSWIWSLTRAQPPGYSMLSSRCAAEIFLLSSLLCGPCSLERQECKSSEG